jgi:hypothetical protein
LTFREVLTSKAGIIRNRQIEDDNITVIDNSEEEILEGVRLMIELTSGDGQNYNKFMGTRNNKQRVFDRIWHNTNQNTQPALILPFFLEKYSCLLD